VVSINGGPAAVSSANRAASRPAPQIIAKCSGIHLLFPQSIRDWKADVYTADGAKVSPVLAEYSKTGIVWRVPNGFYIVKVQSGHQLLQKKILVTR